MDRALTSQLLLPVFAAGLTLLGAAGCKSDRARATEAPLQRPATVGALVRRAINAMRSGDAGAYVSLLATASEATQACPERFAQRGEKKMRERWLRALEKTRQGVASCHSMIPWDKAREISRKGGETGEKLERCKDPVRRISDITLLFEVDRIRYEVILRRPYLRRDSVFGFADGPRCRRQAKKARHRK